MERLANVAELLDGPLGEPAVLDGNLRDLRRVNRILGGIALSRQALDILAPNGANPAGEPVDLLDVGTGGADIPVALLADWRRRGRHLRVTASDDRLEILTAARRTRPALDRIADLRLEVADGRSLPYPDGAFDVAHASLVLHHLEPADAIGLLREMARVARRGVIVNDLARGRLTWLGAWLLGHLATTNPWSRNDAPLSARRAYTRPEVERLLAAAGLRPIWWRSALLRHRFAVVAVP